MGQLTQDNRLLRIDSPLGKDLLLLVSCTGNESLSQLFNYEISFLSSDKALKPDKLIGKTVLITLNTPVERLINAYISELSMGDVLPEADGLREYKAMLVPWLWFLNKKSNCKIYQNKSVIEIAEEVFKGCGFTDYKKKLSTNYVKREFCVQYNETDFEFISRLFQEEGIAYHYEHEKSRHVLILTDANNAFTDCEEATVDYIRGTYKDTHISEWSRNYQFVTGEVSVTDYNYEKPTTKLLSSSKTLVKLPNIKKYEIYRYPGSYTELSKGKNISKIEMESIEQSYDEINAVSDCGSFIAGKTFKLKNHESTSEAGKYLITSLSIKVNDTNYTTVGDDDSSYVNNFTCIPDTVKYRPVRTYQKTRVYGPQTATVVGPSGEEIYTDKLNRIKVQFHWDRLGKNDENSSCWLRVAESFSGKKWGTHFLPRIGQEVIIEFINGDPDMPIVTGSVYNGDNNPPYSAKTQSGIKTQSTKQAGSSNYNELRFDDKKGGEEIFIQAEKDFTRLVKNNEKGEINAKQTQTIKNDRVIIVTDGNESIDIAKGNRDLTVSKNCTTKASKVLIEASQEIKLKVGGSSIKLTPAGIVIKSTKVDVKGDAMVVIKGGLTKIN